MQVWKRRVAFMVSVLGGVGLLMSSAEAREPRDRRLPPPPTMPVDFTFPSLPPPPTMPPPTSPPSTSPPPTMPPSTSPPTSSVLPTIPPELEETIEATIETLKGFGSQFQELIDFLTNPFSSF